MNKILVTGASGNIGTELVKLLKESGADFEIMRSKPGAPEGGVPTRYGSFESAEALTAAFQGIDTLFVLLPLVPHKLDLARNVAAAAKAAGVKHVVRSSGAGADAAAHFALPRLQGQIDDALRQTGIPSTFLLNGGFMQNYATFGAQMVKDGMWYSASADAPQSLIDVRDIAAVAVQVLTHPAAHAGGAYTLTGSDSLTDSERVAILSQAVAKRVAYTAISLETADNVMRNEWHMPEFMISLMRSLNELVSAGYASGVSSDVERLLGRAPITFAQFAADYKSAWA
jgi:uncharacterized protein YbjT (DUF2867 family)